MENKIIDHLFRHQYGKMVAILTHYFGLSHLETIEDAVQDTFIKATLQWRSQIPENPEAWLNKVAKNRTIDLLRNQKTQKNQFEKINSDSIPSEKIFLNHEIEDSQLRMIFVACHPILKPEEQIAFALKTISGFSLKEIAAALLIKEETIKKRLSRAKKRILKNNIRFDFPPANEIQKRLDRVMEVIYLTFNEGFHSTNKTKLIRKDLCGEAIRLAKLLLKKEKFRSGNLYALFALMCFHSSRLDSKINSSNEIVNIKEQDRSKWYFPLVKIGNTAMKKAMEYDGLSIYHYESAIAAEHIKAKTFENTDWNKILNWYTEIYQLQPTVFTSLSMAIVNIQLDEFRKAKQILDSIVIADLEQRAYLYYACYSEYYAKNGAPDKAVYFIEKAIQKTSNNLERQYLINKKKELSMN